MLLTFTASRMTSYEVILAALQARALRTDNDKDIREAWENHTAERDKVNHHCQQKVELNADGIETPLDAWNDVGCEDDMEIHEDGGANVQKEIIEEH
jgi:hypothetical protein